MSCRQMMFREMRDLWNWLCLGRMKGSATSLCTLDRKLAASVVKQLIKLLLLVTRIHEPPETKVLGYWFAATIEQYNGDGRRKQGLWSQIVAFKGTG